MVGEGKAKSTDRDSEPKRIGKVHRFIKTDRGLFPWNVLAKYEVDKPESRGLKEDSSWWREHGLVREPFNSEMLVYLMDNNTYFDQCVRQIAKDVVGQGYEVVPREEGKENEDEKKVVQEFMEEANAEGDTICRVLEKALIDWGSVGRYGLEVSRDSDAKVNGVFHNPGHTIFVHETKKKYCQIRDSRKKWFKAYGEETEINENTGEEYKTKRGKYKAHEMIYRREYYPKSDYYGRPNILPAVVAVRGMMGVHEYNISFFDNYGIPAAFVTLEGDWEEGSAKYLSDFIDVEMKGADNSHRTVVMEVPQEGKISWEPIVVDKKESSFELYFKHLLEEILVAYKMPPYRLGIAEVGKLGGTTAPEATKIYNQSIVKPLEKETATILNQDLIRDGLQIESYIVKFNEIDTRDMDALIKRWKDLIGVAAITPGYIAGQLGLKTDDMPHADQYYIASTLVPVEEAGTVTPQTVKATEEELGKMVDNLIQRAAKEGKINV